MVNDRLFDTLSGFDTVRTSADMRRLLGQFVEEYDLSSAAYLGIGVGGHRPGQKPYVAATYSAEWITHYTAENYVEIDPVIQIGMRRMLPIDWKQFEAPEGRTRRLFGESVEFGLGRHGLSIPVHGLCGDRALFSITSDGEERDWRSKRTRFLRDFHILATYAHSTVLELEGAAAIDATLSPRERECLLWVAEGKTAWECSVILGLSYHTVRCYLESARHKLKASSNTHAVVKAMRAGLFAIIP